jgi:transposase InsO family protein
MSDNGSQFSLDEFATFMKRNGIKHFKSAPYHPATNGLAERFIQTFVFI